LTSPQTIDLLGLGIAPVDFFVSMDAYPPVGKKIDAIPGSHLIAHGGPVGTALCTFRKLGGGSASLITSFGDDDWGRFARAELVKFGVASDHCIIRKNCTSALAFAWVEMAHGDRTIALDMSPKLFIKPADIEPTRLPVPKLIHMDGRHVAANVKLARWGKKVGARIMLDVGSVRNQVDDIFPYLDYLVCADQYALHYWKTKSIRKAVERFKAMGIPEVVVTAGTAGSYGIDASGASHFQKAYKIKAVDVTGAGDVYHGSYLFGISRGWDIAHKMKFAAAAAALKCTRPGARSGIPTRRAATTFMNNHRRFYA